MRTDRFLLATVGLGLLLGGLACGPDRDERAAIEAAIEWSDSLRRRPTTGGQRVAPSDVPIAAKSDSDSVTMVRINYSRKVPQGEVLIDGGPRRAPERPPERTEPR